MSTKTTNYNLTKPDLTENADITVLNTDLDLIDTELKNNSNKTGILSGLNTTVKTDLVSAVNEVKTSTNKIGSATLNTTAQDLSGGLNEHLADNVKRQKRLQLGVKI